MDFVVILRIEVKFYFVLIKESRISQRVAPTREVGSQPIIWQFFVENCMKMKEIRSGQHIPGAIIRISQRFFLLVNKLRL